MAQETKTTPPPPDVEVMPPDPAPWRNPLAGIALNSAGKCFVAGLAVGLIAGIGLVYVIRKRF